MASRGTRTALSGLFCPRYAGQHTLGALLQSLFRHFLAGVLRSSPIKNRNLAHLGDAYPSRNDYAAIIARLRDRRVEAQDSYLSSS